MKWLITAILLILPVHAFSVETPRLGVSTVLSNAEGMGEGNMIKVWEKDPFAPPSVHTAVESAGREAAPDLSLSTILFSDERSTAVINGKMFHIGDDISGQKILDIKRTYVIVGNEKKSYRLELRK